MKSNAKYSVGDYIVADDRVYARIRAYIEGEEHVYAIELPQHKNEGTQILWYTEFEMDQKLGNIHVAQPDFKRFAKLKAGDILHVSDDIYTTVLARVGDLALLSDIPHKHNAEVKTIHKLAEQLKELSDGSIDIEELILDDDAKKNLKNEGSSRYTKRVASMWKPVDWIALMNWPIVEE